VLTAKDAEIFKGVDTTQPPHHAKLVPGWTPPAPPPGCHLVAILAPVTLEGGHKTHMWVLDYLDTETAVFASEDHDFTVEWPWVLGYLPQPGDWDAIGIPNLT
jgi:hypothetical protein